MLPLWGRPLAHSHPQLSPGPGTSLRPIPVDEGPADFPGINKHAAAGIEGSGPKAGFRDRQSFCTETKRLFKGIFKSRDTYHRRSGVEQPPRNAGQPLRPSPTVIESSGAADSLPKTRNPRQSLPAEPPDGVPTAGPRTHSGWQGESSGGPQSMDRYSNTEARRDGHPTDIDEQLDPPQTVMKLGDGAGFFQNSSGVIVNNSTLTDKSRIIHIENTLIQGKTALDVLCEEMTPGADLDSAARWPRPSCYPGTRTRLTTEIQTWFFDNGRKWNLLWLNGPAGVGKSAVAQTVAEYALENGILGAVYFFSRPNKRYKYAEVFITLAYQLAVRFPGYKTLVGEKLGAEPDLLTKTPHIQFRKLIVEPLLSLSHERKRVIILDGLDECDAEDNQLEVIELINDLVRSNISLPIIWMICSRPESHLKRIFARPDHPIQCWREFLPVDSEESRNDTETFIRGRFKMIHKRYGECLEEDADGSWPPEAFIQQIIVKTSGLFVLADTFLRYIEDPKTRDPDQRLSEILILLRHSYATGSRNPMHDLDSFYSRILSNIPDDHWSIARQILVASTFRTPGGSQLTAQSLCNLLGISSAKFYAAMSRLHSVIHVPEPSDASKKRPHFFHATFLDYLTDQNRAGRFFIGQLVTDCGITVAAGLQDFMLSGLRCLGSTMGLARLNEHKEEVEGNEGVSSSLMAALSWPSRDTLANWTDARAAMGNFREFLLGLLSILLAHSEHDDELFGVLRHFNFNALPFTMVRYDRPGSILSHLNKLRPSSLVRTQSISDWDQALLSKVAKQYPGSKPLDFDDPHEGFFLLGDGTNSVAVLWGGYDKFEYVSQGTPPQVWPILQHASVSWR
ncbi:hypothetical protein P691DRAFT_777040 [Macrolepiota fuliginosa MF-IS2]|uniref:NACHT domain-containing protein n=1 Tax=Macrolepiota fuliginosa MF-IS2 TaxID=1400762 RepID=A0A9P5X7C2_9AGAR|nr:hypothetical protein P691DRAFT_777040 [Macrolepiota fuliginosa MF-IS2]